MTNKKTPRRGELREAFGGVQLGGERSEGNQPRPVQQALQRLAGAPLAAIHEAQAQHLRAAAASVGEHRAEALLALAASLGRRAEAQRAGVAR